MIEKYTIGDFSTNTYVLSKGNKAIIIDPSINFEKIIDRIKSEYQIVAVLITHAHIDHVDGIKYLEDYPIYFPRIDYLYLKDPGYTLYGWYNEELPFNPEELDIHLLDNGNIIKIDDFKIECYATPGHTLGGMIFKYEDVIFTGDTLFKSSIGRTDLKGGDLRELYKSICFILDTFDPETRLFPGHDSETTIKDEKVNNLYYIDASKTI